MSSAYFALNAGKDILYESVPWTMFPYVQYVLRIIKQRTVHPYLDCRQYLKGENPLVLNLHLRSLGSLGIRMQMHTKIQPHNLPATIHPSLHKNNSNGAGQIGHHKMSLPSPGTRDGEIQTLDRTNSSMQYQCLRTHTRSIFQTCINYCQALPHLHYSSYYLVLLHLPCHPFHKTRNSLRIHHDLPSCPLNPFQIQTTNHPYHFITLISRTIQLIT
jgi:hypothetical protein